ncbi:MAG: protoporphyrinogen oxidase [Acidobacteria bacterium]|nr:protoporphyrinogen oxidase [Acidobacteriota bacterium]MBS1866679.1 protoporphyrinogen oxidase [Acidobacteriota bacterium]
MTAPHSVIVVGAGISGLACAYALKKRGVDVLVLEASNSPGGLIRSVEENGYLFETGPQSFSTTPQLGQLIHDLGLSSELVTAPTKAPRYILINGQLRPVPLSPGAFLTSSLLSWSTKLSILRDPFTKSCPPVYDESIADFVRRKFAPELLDRIVGPFVSGIYAGDPEKISLRAAFPTIYEAEKSAGSIVRGMKAVARNRSRPREKPALASFRRGNQTLVEALSTMLGDSLRLGADVSRITKSGDGTLTIATETKQFESRELVLAAPTSVAASLLQNLAPTAADVLSQIEYAPVAIVSFSYRRSDVSHPLNGFGFLVPRSSNLKLLGAVWNSSLFPNRAPNDQVLLTCFLGGATDPTTAHLSGSSLADLVHRELTPILGLKSQPVTARVTVYKQAIPQYNLGHLDRLATIQSELAKIPCLHLIGNYLKGPAIGTCVEHAQSVAESIRIG